MKFKGEVIGVEELKALFERAPKTYIRYFRAFLNYAGKIFIGNKSKDGVLREKLSGKKSLRSGGPWSRKFINSVARYEIDREKMVMHAGIIYSSKKKIHEIMELLESGYSKNTGNYMIVPNYREMHDKKPIGTFSRMVTSNQLKPIFTRGKIYYIDKQTGKLLFTGVKQIAVKSQFNFDETWKGVEPKISKKADTVLDRATAAVEKAESKGVMFDG